jgi:hypothetical protein
MIFRGVFGGLFFLRDSVKIVVLFFLFMYSIGHVCSVEANTYILSKNNKDYKSIFNAKFNYDTKILNLATAKGNGFVKILIKMANPASEMNKEIILDGNGFSLDLSEVKINKGENAIEIQPIEGDLYLNKSLTLHFIATETTGSKSMADLAGPGYHGSSGIVETISNRMDDFLNSAWNTINGKENGSNGKENGSNGNNGLNGDNGSSDGNPNGFGRGNSSLILFGLLSVLGIVLCVYYFRKKK